jgi:hypothetical protein
MDSKAFQFLTASAFFTILLASLVLFVSGILLFKFDPPSFAPPQFEEVLAARVGQEYTIDTHNSVIKIAKNSDTIVASSHAALNAFGRVGVFLGGLLLGTGIVSSVALWRAYSIHNKQNKPAHPTAGNVLL